MSIYMVTSKWSKDHFITEKCEVFRMCNYASLPATEEMWEAVLL